MPELRTRLDAMRARWNALGASMRIALAVAAAAMVGAGIFLMTRGNDPTYGVLFANLEEQDAAQVVEKLKELHVPYKLSEDGTAILVPETTVHETRLSLADAGLPRGGGVGFEIFDEPRFGESEFAEQVKYHRALEGELQRTLAAIAGVDHARVHLVLPTRTLFASDESQASASVALALRPGARLTDEQVRGVVHLVASSVRGLQPADVTVVDGEGRPLAGAEQESEELASRSLEVRRDIERQKERAVQQMLDATLGPGKSVARVSADVTFATEERTEETYDPATIAERSHRIVEEREGGPGETAQGVPGAPSNLPGGPAPALGSVGTAGMVRRSETRNFEVSRVTHHTAEPVGRVKRLDVAVVVDGNWSGTGRHRRFSPLSHDEMARLSSLVASAVGARTENGDRVTVECVPFAERPAEDVASGGASASRFPLPAWAPYAGAAGAALLFAGGALMIAIRRRRRAKDGAKNGVAGALPGAPGPALGAGVTVPAAAQDAHEPLIAAELASKDPQLAADVLRAWLLEEVPS